MYYYNTINYSSHYGAQAVVVSIDPKRVYISNPMFETSSDNSNSTSTTTDIERIQIISESEDEHPMLALFRGMGRTVVHLSSEHLGPNGEEWCWWPVTVKGGREVRVLDAVMLAKICEVLGAGEIMLNCINMDGQGNGYDIPLINAVQNIVSIPVIASSGAGKAEHFAQGICVCDIFSLFRSYIYTLYYIYNI